MFVVCCIIDGEKLGRFDEKGSQFREIMIIYESKN